MFGDIRKTFIKLNEVDCSLLTKPVENYITVVPKTDENDFEHDKYYYLEPNVCLKELLYN